MRHPVMEQLQEYMAAEAALDVRKMDVYFKELRIDHIPPQYIPAAVQENVADILVRLLVGLWVHPNIARLPSDASLSGNTSQSRDTSRPSGLAQSTDDEVPRATSEPREATGGRLDRDPRAASEPPDAGQSTDVSQLQDNGGPMETSEPGHLGQANDHQKPRAYSEPRDIHQSEDATEQRAIRPHRARSDPRGARR
ncbi:uncharacterized protein KY384_001686 [Bacidia gigantensis]|uniref:uncharacterized protein n=1 Tax=Bacidia gigantensis TaxID=2732470 RepID=UPI001D049132|nr:uncharacterized protein KY384_001686 [Bacidia gigantensis]KAG8533945.1 hypothetical protein KY384_001686 [Bacidia gigantensis]